MFLKKTALVVSIYLCSLSTQAENKTILLLGQSGVGKTTTINALYNAAMNDYTLQDNKNWVQFIAPIREGSKNQIPCPNSIPITSVEKTITYAEFTFNSRMRSDTHKIIGYQFTPKITGWNPNDVLEIIDTPGINNTGNTKCDNQSIHLQIIRKIEEYLHEYGNQTYAIFVVVSNNMNRTDDQGQDPVAQAFAALRDALPPEICERIFIVTNRVPYGDKTNDDLKHVINENFTWGKNSAVISCNNYIPENPTYIAKFNRFLQSTKHSNFQQEQREHTEKNLRTALRKIGDLTTPLPLQGYPEYLKYKHETAKNISHAVDTQFEIDTLHTKCQLLQKKFTDAKDAYNYAHGQPETITDDFSNPVNIETATSVDWILKTPKILDDLFFYFSYQGDSDPILRMRAKEAQQALQETQQKITTLNNTYSESIEQAHTALDKLQASEYNRDKEFSSVDFTQSMQKRIKMHFPELFHNYYQHKQVETYIKNICAHLTQ